MLTVLWVVWSRDIEECLLEDSLSWLLECNAEEELCAWVGSADLDESFWDGEKSFEGLVLWCGKGGAEDGQKPEEV